MTIREKQQNLIADFDFLDNWEDKYQYLIDLGKSLPEMELILKNDKNLIRGCQSKVWLTAEEKDGKIFFHADSDGILPKGIISLLVSVFSGYSPKEILDSNFEFINEIGLSEFLSPSRANGLSAMSKQIKFYAAAFQLKL